MAGFRVEDYFTLFIKSNINGRHCKDDSCKFKNKDTSHYDCNLCSFARHGYAKSRMEKHISTEHSNESNAASGMPKKISYSVQLSDYSVLLNADNLSIVEPHCSPPEVSQCTAQKSFIIKKRRISTPLPSETEEVELSSPSISPLAQKTDICFAPYSEPASSSKACVVADCTENVNLKPLARKKARGRGGIVDWENTKLLFTYYRLGKVEEIFDRVICDSHWREWYSNNLNLKKILSSYIYHCPRTSLFSSTPPSNFETLEGSEFLELFNSRKCCSIIFESLNIFELKNLSITCRALDEKVENYFKHHLVSWEKLLQTLMMSQPLEGLSHRETFTKLYSNITEIRHSRVDSHDMPEIIEHLENENDNASNVNSELRVILNFFGNSRQPTSLEILVYVAAKYLRRGLKRHTSFVKNIVGDKNKLTSFSVGVEAFSLPSVFHILYIVLTGQSACLRGCAEQVKQTLFRCLAITSVLQKMVDYKVVTPFHRVLSNEASLTCSKVLIGVLNRCGVSFSYAKDLKDCKYARQLWNSIGIKTTMQNTSSNIHWIECDNLETMLKTTSIHNAKRLTHFMTLQLEYVANLTSVIDLYEKPESHDVDTQCFEICSCDNALYNNFLQESLQKYANLKESLSCENVISALSHNSTHDNADIKPFSLKEDISVAQRILSSNKLLATSTSVYLHMEQLCSSNIQDVKKLLDLTADDYGLNCICYIPSIVFTPLLFASRALNAALIKANLEGEGTLPEPYFVQWGFVPLEPSVTCFSADNYRLDLPRVIVNAINKLKDYHNGIFAATKLIESTIQVINEK